MHTSTPAAVHWFPVGMVLALLLSKGIAYDCGSKSGNVTVSVDPPNGVFPTEAVAVLKCKSSLGKATTPTWYFKGQRISPKDPFYGIKSTPVESSLTIGLLNVSDDGVYVCRIDDDCNSKRITVVTGVKVLQLGGQLKVYQRHNVTLEVEVVFVGDVSVTWTFDGTELREEKDTVSGRRTFRFRVLNADLEDEGVYNVTVVSLQKVSTDSVTFTLTVILPPSNPRDVKCLPQSSGALLIQWSFIQDTSSLRDNPDEFLVTWVEAGSNGTAQEKNVTAGSQNTEISGLNFCTPYVLGAQTMGSVLRSSIVETQCTVRFPPIDKTKVFQSGGVVYMSLNGKATPVCLSPQAYRQYLGQRRQVCLAVLDLEEIAVADKGNGYAQMNLQVNTSRDFIGMITKECPFNVVKECPSDHFLNNLSFKCSDFLPPDLTTKPPVNKSNTGQIVGIAVGVAIFIIALVIIIVLVRYCCRKRRSRTPIKKSDIEGNHDRDDAVNQTPYLVEIWDTLIEIRNKLPNLLPDGSTIQTQRHQALVHVEPIRDGDAAQRKANERPKTMAQGREKDDRRKSTNFTEEELSVVEIPPKTVFEDLEDAVTRMEELEQDENETETGKDVHVLANDLLKALRKWKKSSAHVSAVISQPQEADIEETVKKTEDPSPLSVAAATGSAGNGDSLSFYCHSPPTESMIEETTFVSSGDETVKIRDLENMFEILAARILAEMKEIAGMQAADLASLKEAMHVSINNQQEIIGGQSPDKIRRE